MYKGALSFIVAICLFQACSSKPMDASTIVIFRNGKVWTVDEKLPLAQAVAMTGDRIFRLGTNDEIDGLRSGETVVVDLGGKLLLPGFNGSHIHFANGGRNLLSVRLRDASSPDEFVRRIGDFARALPKCEWILGGDWDHERWAGAPLPTRQLIDAITPGKLADLVVLSQDIFSIPPEQIGQTEVLYTVVGSRVVYA